MVVVPRLRRGVRRPAAGVVRRCVGARRGNRFGRDSANATRARGARTARGASRGRRWWPFARDRRGREVSKAISNEAPRGRSSWAFERIRGRAPADARKRVSLSESEKKTPPRGIARPSSSVASRTTESESESESVEKETEKEPRSSSERGPRRLVPRQRRRPPRRSRLRFFRESHRLSEKLARVKYAVVGAPPRSRRGAGKTPAARRKTRRSPQSMKPTISFSARRARARTADAKSRRSLPVSRFVTSCSRAPAAIDRAARARRRRVHREPRASNRRTIWRLEGFAPGGGAAPLAKKTRHQFRSIPKSSQRYETNPRLFFDASNSNLNSSKRAQQARAHDPERVVPRENAASPASAARARGGANAPNRNEGRAFLAADVPSARLARLASLSARRRRRVASVPAALRRDFISERRSTGTPYARG